MSQEMTNLESSMASMTVKDSTTFSTPFTGSTSNIPQGTVIYMAPEQMQARENSCYVLLTNLMSYLSKPLKSGSPNNS
jgi:hypothetical protein